MLLGLDARWLGVRGWGLMLLLALATPALGTPGDALSQVWSRLLAGLLMVLAVLLTSLGHELGHVVASRLAGVAVRAVVLAPSGGVTIRAATNAASVDFLTALAGPVANALLGAVAVWTLIVVGPDAMTSQFLIELAALQVLAALANLVPWGPLDGQRIVAAWRAL
jgi:Zn-dependent protease